MQPRAPAHTRAWIETGRSWTAERRRRGRPLTRGRGLKLSTRLLQRPAGRRPLTRGRGLKQGWKQTARDDREAPAHTRAWIETKLNAGSRCETDGRPLTRGRGLKPLRHRVPDAISWAPAHTRAWIETAAVGGSPLTKCRRPLTRGRGLKHGNRCRDAGRQRGARSHAGVD